jgi:hypothetical protein
MDRRSFLSTVIRGGIIVGLTAASGYLLMRKDENKGSECNSICNGCNSLSSCNKPEAIKTKMINNK